MEEALTSLKGKKVYIDVWATWCGSCIDEFKYKATLEKTLAENDIQLLYISIDKDERDQNWKDGIKYHGLNGTHMRANKDFFGSLAKLYGDDGSIAIPWYILIDEDGNIIEKHAKSPAQIAAGEKLINK